MDRVPARVPRGPSALAATMIDEMHAKREPWGNVCSTSGRFVVFLRIFWPLFEASTAGQRGFLGGKPPSSAALRACG